MQCTESRLDRLDQDTLPDETGMMWCEWANFDRKYKNHGYWDNHLSTYVGHSKHLCCFLACPERFFSPRAHTKHELICKYQRRIN